MSTRSRSIDIDAPCGRHLTYRDLIQCGETQQRTGIQNTPEVLETYAALKALAQEILDPVIDQFGPITLTYGFCSAELAKHVAHGIAPCIDQHASHELNRKGNPICSRLGAAADFSIADFSMTFVAAWIAFNTKFDRLYFYGQHRPLHVSVGPDYNRQIVKIHTSDDGRRIPKVVKNWNDFFDTNVINQVMSTPASYRVCPPSRYVF